MPEILTARLRLRHFHSADVDLYHAAIHSDPDVMRYMVGGLPRPREQTAAMIARAGSWWWTHRFGVWALERVADGVLIGHCGLTQDPDSGDVELSYALARPTWGQGLATEAARACLRYAFERIIPHQHDETAGRVIALARPENAASRRVMEKAGMQYAGISTAHYGGLPLTLCVATRAAYTPPDDPYLVIEDLHSSKLLRPA